TSDGVLRAQTQAAADASSSVSRVRNINASGMRFAASAVPSCATGELPPPAPPMSPNPPKPPPPKPPNPPKPNAAPVPVYRSTKPSPRTYSALWLGTPGPGDGCVILTCRPVAQIT